MSFLRELTVLPSSLLSQSSICSWPWLNKLALGFLNLEKVVLSGLFSVCSQLLNQVPPSLLMLGSFLLLRDFTSIFSKILLELLTLQEETSSSRNSSERFSSNCTFPK
ncbi:unnamed protein product [Moneuplotes crassus]|uniref:Uncharacterized protein n=1 Tax=Euplotes crassus TaxID=5936 RepID=A0AAD1Y4S5_EUPCR|nr:unnamed protein product [Moneuplotes crassus]